MTHNRTTLRLMGRMLSQMQAIPMLKLRALALTLGCSRSHLRAVFTGKKRSPRIERDPRFIALRARELPRLEWLNRQRSSLLNFNTLDSTPAPR